MAFHPSVSMEVELDVPRKLLLARFDKSLIDQV